MNHSKPKSRLNASQLMTSDGRYGLNPNIRNIKAARRQLPFQTRNVDNYVSNYLSTNHLNSNYFLKSDGLLNSMSGQSFGSGLQTTPDMSYSIANYRPIRESPNSQLGNIPFVKLTASGSQSSPLELRPKAQTNKPVTVRIAPMPQNLSKIKFNRSSNSSTTNVSTFGTTETAVNTTHSTQKKNFVEALKRKRVPKQDIESEDNFKVSANKKPKRDSLNEQQIPNGLMSSQNKQSIKRQSVEGKQLLPKRFKNNEILSSYSSLQTPPLSQISKTKRKLSPDSMESTEVKTKKSLLPEEEDKTSNAIKDNGLEFKEMNDLSIDLNQTRREPEESGSKKTYGLPLHLHSMEDHERDRNKTRLRLNRFLNAVKEVTSPKTDSIAQQSEAPEVIQTSSSSEIGLPSTPAAAIFTNSRVETVVTTTLLNTPISSVLTTTRESLSPPKLCVDNNADNSMTSAPNSPEVSAITKPITSFPFSSSTPLSTPIGGIKITTNESSFKFDAKPIGMVESNSTTSASTTSQPFVTSNNNNLFNSAISTGMSSTPVLQSNSVTTTSIPIPSFASLPAPQPIAIPNFSQMPANNTISFTGSSVPAFPSISTQNNILSTEAPNNTSFFSVGTGSTSRRTAQNSRLRSRQKR